MKSFNFRSFESSLKPPVSVFHPGEQLVQQKTGTREQIRTSGMEDFVRPVMTTQHRLFFEQQSLMYLGSRDPEGRPWATVVAGRPGFTSAPDPRRLLITPLRLHPKDPLAHSLHPGAHVGLLGIELHTRRRNRVNGVVAPAAAGAPGTLDIDVSLSFGNCPKYIQGRQLAMDWDAYDRSFPASDPGPGAAGGAEGPAPGRVEAGGRALGAEQRRIVRRADTFFISSCYDGPAPPHVRAASVGCDMSHRGGPPGFVKITQVQSSGEEQGEGGKGSVLRWADYAGNNMFQTLGNLMTQPKAGILIIDFNTGDTLQLTGEATVDFDDRSLPGAQRTVSFAVHGFVHIRAALPVRQVGGVDWSPFLPNPDEEEEEEGATDDEEEADQEQQQGGQQRQAPHKAQQLECVSVVRESPDISTFEFKLPPGADPTAAYLPGQYATFEFPAAAFPAGAAAAGPGPVVRTWTVSSHPAWTAASGTFSISVKRAEGGLVSGLLHRAMAPGATVAFRSFGGDFVPRLPPPPPPPLAAASAQLPSGGGGSGPVLLIAGGIGITPIRAMLHELVLQGTGPGPQAPDLGSCDAAALDLVLLYAVRQVEDAAFLDELAAVSGGPAAAAGSPVQVQLVLAVSQASEQALQEAAARWPGVAVRPGRLSAALLRQYGGGGGGGTVGGLAGVRAAFMCGPPGFMTAVEAGLREGGMDMARLFTESFAF